MTPAYPTRRCSDLWHGVLDRRDCIMRRPAIVDQRLEQHFGGLPGARLVDDPFDGLLRDASAHVASMRALDCSFFMTARLHFQHTEPRYFPLRWKTVTTESSLS